MEIRYNGGIAPAPEASVPDNIYNEYEGADQADQKKFKSWEAQIREAGVTEQDATDEQLWEYFTNGKIPGNEQTNQRLKEINKQQGQEMVVNGLLSKDDYEKLYNKD